MSGSSILERIFEFPPTICPEGLDIGNFEECLAQYLNRMHAKGHKQPKAAISKQQKNQTPDFCCLAGSFSTQTCDVSPFREITGTGDGLNTVLVKAPVEGQGRWFFEAVLCTSGIMQIGWANPNCMFNDYSGVGDEQNSFGIDGKRNTFWCGKDSIDIDINWVSGDVITSVIDIKARTLTFYRNGNLISLIDVPSISKGAKYLPAVSLFKNERVLVNMGDVPFLFKVKDAFSTRAEPSAASRGKVRYIVKSLFKLIKDGQEIDEDIRAVLGCQLLDNLVSVFNEAGMDNATFLLLTEFIPGISTLRTSSGGGAILTRFFEYFLGTFDKEYFEWFIKMMIKHYSVCYKCFSIGKQSDKIEALENIVFILRCTEQLAKLSDILSSDTLLEDILGMKFLTAKDLSLLFPPINFRGNFDIIVNYMADHGDLYKTYQVILNKQCEIAEMLHKNKMFIPWLNYLINKNLDMNKAFIPPGLSSIVTLSNAFVLSSCLVTKYISKPLSITTSLIKQMCFNFTGFREEAERVGGAVSYLLKEHGIPDAPKDRTDELWEIVDLCAHLFCLGEKRIREQECTIKDVLRDAWIGHDMDFEVAKEYDSLAQKVSWYVDLSFRDEARVGNGITDIFVEIINIALANEDILCFVPKSYFEVVLIPGLRRVANIFDPKVLTLLFTLAERNVLMNPDLQRTLSDALLLIPANPLSKPMFDSVTPLARSYVRALLALVSRDEPALLRFFSVPEQGKENMRAAFRAEFEGGGAAVDTFFDRVFELVNKTFTGLQVESAQLETRNGAKLSLPYAKGLFNLAGRGLICLTGMEYAISLFSPAVVVGRELNFFRVCEFAVYLIDRIPTYKRYFGEIVGKDNGIVEIYEIKLVKILNDMCVMCERDFDRVADMLERFANFRPEALTALSEAHKDIAPKDFAALCEFLKKRKRGDKSKKEKMGEDVLKEALSQSSLDDSSLCEICYTNERDTVFEPCGHSSCRLCIERHMTTDKTCFFCKKEITSLK